MGAHHMKGYHYGEILGREIIPRDHKRTIEGPKEKTKEKTIQDQYKINTRSIEDQVILVTENQLFICKRIRY